MTTDPLRIVFAGTPEFSARNLNALIKGGTTPVAVYTQPDRPAGRGKKLQASPVKQLAESAQIPVFQPTSLKGEAQQEQFEALRADLMIVVAYGLILPRAVLAAPSLGCINVHASLLPRWRGAAPIQRAIEAGDSTTGITIMQMDEGLDTGAMLATRSCPIEATTTAASLHDTLADIGADLLQEVLHNLSRYQQAALAQDDALATYANKILKSEAQLDWRSPAISVERAIRAFNPFPVCYTYLGDLRLKVWEAVAVPVTAQGQVPGTIISADNDGINVACGEGQLRIKQLQLPGAKVLSVQQVLQSKSALFAPGTLLDAS